MGCQMLMQGMEEVVAELREATLVRRVVVLTLIDNRKGQKMRR